jgi:hypothetical protein
LAISWLCWNSAQSIFTSARRAEQRFGRRFLQARLAGTGGAEAKGSRWAGRAP